MNVRAFAAVVAAVLCSSVSTFAQTLPVTLAWDPSPEGSVAGYVVYVGQASGAYTEQYDVGNHTTFVYSKAVPGRPYYFAVAAYAAGPQMSIRSEEIMFLSGVAAASPGFAAPARVENRRDVAQPDTSLEHSPENRVRSVCSTSGCYEAELIANIPGSVSSLVNAGDSRLLFVESGTRVRVIDHDVLLSRPGLEVEAPREIAGLVLDPDYARTKFVYVGVVQINNDGSRELDIVRYREVADVLGEGAVLVAGLPLPKEGNASLATDPLGRFYVAMPAVFEGDPSGSRFAGKVLRFENDGAAVRSDGPGAPVFALGSARPSSLSWIPQGDALWLTGTDIDSAGTMIPVSGYPGRTAFGADRSILVFADDSGGLSRASMTQNGISASSWITSDALGGIALSATSGPSGTYLALADSLLPATDGLVFGTVNTRIIRLHQR